MSDKKDDKREVQLKVAEAQQDDVGKGIVRLDSKVMKKLGVKPGDPVEIEGDKKTVAIAGRCYPADIGLSIIRMDGYTRWNSGSGVGEKVDVRKAEVKEAKKVVLAPANKKMKLVINSNLLKKNLKNRCLREGDTISLGGGRRRKITFGDSSFSELFNNLMDDEMFGFGALGLGSEIKLVVAETNPDGNVFVSGMTNVEYSKTPVSTTTKKMPEITYEDIGGLKKEVTKVREMVELPMRHPEVFDKLGVQPPKGLLLYGPPGTGKTLLAKAVASESEANFININGPEIMSKWVGEAEKHLRKIFEDAEKKAPSIIFIDEIDAIASKREESKGEVERRVVAQLLALMDGLESRGKVIVIAATNRPDAIDPALRRPGRFDREIEIGVPDKDGRLEILKIHTRNMPLEGEWYDSIAEDIILDNLEKSEDEDLVEIRKELEAGESKRKRLVKSLRIIYQSEEDVEEDEEEQEIPEGLEPDYEILKEKGIIGEEFGKEVKRAGVNKMLKKFAARTHGFVGADLEAICKEAAMSVIRRIIPEIDWDKEDKISPEILEDVKVTPEDFNNGWRNVSPSAMREVLVQAPNVQWDDVGGLEEVKQKLIESVEWPIEHPDSFKRVGIKPPKGLLLYGPPGTGKTLLAKAVATETEMNFINVKGPELLSKWVGESEKAVRETFRKARQVAPCIIFFDELDSLVPKRGRRSGSNVTEQVVNQLLTELDGLEELHNVIVIAATNRPDMVDPAMLRPGRIDRLLMVPPPDEEARLEILKVHTRNMPLEESVDLEEMADRMEDFSGADIENVCREAAMLALRQDLDSNEVKKKHFEEALSNATPSIDEETIDLYREFAEKIDGNPKQGMKEGLSYLG